MRATDDEGQTATAAKTVTISAPAAGGTSPPPPSGGPAAPPSTGSPPAPTLAVARQKLKAVLAKGLAVRVTCAAPCALKLQLVVDKKTAKKLKLGKKATVVGTLTRSLPGSATLKVKLTGKARKRPKKARSVKLSVRASTAAGD